MKFVALPIEHIVCFVASPSVSQLSAACRDTYRSTLRRNRSLAFLKRLFDGWHYELFCTWVAYWKSIEESIEEGAWVAVPLCLLKPFFRILDLSDLPRFILLYLIAKNYYRQNSTVWVHLLRLRLKSWSRVLCHWGGVEIHLLSPERPCEQKNAKTNVLVHTIGKTLLFGCIY